MSKRGDVEHAANRMKFCRSRWPAEECAVIFAIDTRVPPRFGERIRILRRSATSTLVTPRFRRGSRRFGATPPATARDVGADFRRAQWWGNNRLQCCGRVPLTRIAINHLRFVLSCSEFCHSATLRPHRDWRLFEFERVTAE